MHNNIGNPEQIISEFDNEFGMGIPIIYTKGEKKSEEMNANHIGRKQLPNHEIPKNMRLETGKFMTLDEFYGNITF